MLHVQTKKKKKKRVRCCLPTELLPYNENRAENILEQVKRTLLGVPVPYAPPPPCGSRIHHCNSCGVGHSCSLSLIPWPTNLHMPQVQPKKKQKTKNKTTKNKKPLQDDDQLVLNTLIDLWVRRWVKVSDYQYGLPMRLTWGLLKATGCPDSISRHSDLVGLGWSPDMGIF